MVPSASTTNVLRSWIRTGPSNVLATCDTVNVPPAVAWTLVTLRIVASQTPFDVSRNVTVYVPREATWKMEHAVAHVDARE